MTATNAKLNNARILVIEDDERIVRILSRFLREKGYEVFPEEDPVLIRRRILEISPDLILLDWMLPSRSGIEVLRELRRDRALSTIPVIMVTARGDELDRVEGLLTGADDYVVKPFSMAELEARIVTVLRRSESRQITFFSDERLQIFPDEKRLVVEGEMQSLTVQEWALLGKLLQSRGPVSRSELIWAIWGRGHAVSERAIDVMILKLRRILERDPQVPRYIVTERGAGYRFEREGERRR